MMIMTIITLYSVIWVHHYQTFSTRVPNPNNPSSQRDGSSGDLATPEKSHRGAQRFGPQLRGGLVSGARNLNWGSSDGIWGTENLSSDFPERLRLWEILPANWTVLMKSKVLRQSCVLGPARWSLFCHYRRWSGRYCGQMRRWQDAWLRGSGPKSPRIRVCCGWKWCAKHNGNPNFDGW
jgi:hypothetical protein